MDKSKVGINIRKYRKERGLSQKKLGDLCGITDSNIRKYELGKQNPKIETLQKIAEALEIDVINLFGYEEYNPKIEDNILKEEAKRRRIDKIIASLENIGCMVIFSSLQSSDIPNGKCFIYFNNNENYIVVNDDELLEIEKSSNDFLKFKFNELINSKEIIDQPLVEISLNGSQVIIGKEKPKD
ncbi:MAG: helix-turn-helix domain-containing protein [Erysipelotrichaceae bacterium]|nr:helix-turn-helix domain-containing protein [Erysipelotrichaceae bacterium]